MRNFNRGHSPGERHLFLKIRDSLKKSKAFGELDFRHVSARNESLFLNLEWRLINNPTVSSANSTNKLKAQPSGEEFRKSKCHLLSNNLWSIMNRRRVQIFEDRWVLHQPWPLQKPAITPLKLITVDKLISRDNRKWDEDLIRTVFDSKTASSIINIPLNTFDPLGRDKLFCILEKNGIFSSKSAYKSMVELETMASAATYKINVDSSVGRSDSCTAQQPYAGTHKVRCYVLRPQTLAKWTRNSPKHMLFSSACSLQWNNLAICVSSPVTPSASRFDH